MADKSDSAYHWSPTEALQAAIEFCESTPVNKCYIVLINHEAGRNGENDTIQQDHYIAGLGDLEAVGALQTAIARRLP